VTVEGSDRVGSVAEEAARLLGVFAAGMPEAHLLAAGSRVAGESPTDHVCPECGHDPHARSSADSVCRICPICRVLNVVKAISPETLDKIADVVDLVSEGLRGFAANRRAESPAPNPASTPPPAPGPTPPPAPAGEQPKDPE
jgi:hypothetical protein